MQRVRPRRADTPYASSAAILMYHRVAVLSGDVHRLCIAPAIFREHMCELRTHYHPMALTDLTSAVGAGHLPSRAVAVTFDDGCLDNLTVASDILQEFDIPATFFIGTERLDEEHEFWWDVLERILISAQPLPPQLDLHEDGVEVYLTGTADEREATHRFLGESIRGLGARTRDTLMSRIAAWSEIDLTPRDTHRPMVADEVRELSRRPRHAIGAHGVHHLSLPSQPADVQRREVFESKETLECLLGTDVTAFAYPYGHHDATTIELVASGFAVAVTTTPGAASMDANSVALPRVDASQLTRGDLGVALDAI